MQRHLRLRLRLKTAWPAGVYCFIDRRGEVLYVGKATNLRARAEVYSPLIVVERWISYSERPKTEYTVRRKRWRPVLELRLIQELRLVI